MRVRHAKIRFLVVKELRFNRRISRIRCNTLASILCARFFKKMRISFHDFFHILNCRRMSVPGNITARDLEYGIGQSSPLENRRNE